jgi:hypothetical protein
VDTREKPLEPVEIRLPFTLNQGHSMLLPRLVPALRDRRRILGDILTAQ